MGCANIYHPSIRRMTIRPEATSAQNSIAAGSLRHCQLDSATQNLLQDAGFRLCDRPRPDRVRPCPKDPERWPADHLTLQIERVVDSSMRRQKPLR
jgi:hypothetical protein